MGVDPEFERKLKEYMRDPDFKREILAIIREAVHDNKFMDEVTREVSRRVARDTASSSRV